MDNTNDKDKNEEGSLAKALEAVSTKAEDEDITAAASNTAKEESLENIQKNPLLLNPVIRCVLTFLNINDIKKCRLVAQEWNSNGKLALASRSVIRFRKNRPGRLPADFRSCFLDSTTVFSAFEISGDLIEHMSDSHAMAEELTNFFGEQKKYLKELTLRFWHSDKTAEKNIDLSTWISKSPMVQKDAKHHTKLSFEGYSYGKQLNLPPLHLNDMIAHIKDLTLSCCQINLQPGIRIFPVKLKLESTNFFQDGTKLNQVRINDIVDLRKAKVVTLHRDWTGSEATKYVLDLSGNTTLDNLTLRCVDVVNGKTSQWNIGHLSITNIPYSLNSLMKIKELSLSCGGAIDLFTLPISIQKLALTLYTGENPTTLICSQPIVIPNLQYLHISDSMYLADCSILSHFMNCSQLAHLKLSKCGKITMNSLWMPKSVKTLTLDYSTIEWVKDSSFHLENYVKYGNCNMRVLEYYSADIRVDNLVILNSDIAYMDGELVNFWKNRKKFNFGKRIFFGNSRWLSKRCEVSLFKAYGDVESLFYAFENGDDTGRALSEKEFYELMPKLREIQQHL